MTASCHKNINSLRTSPEYTRPGIYGKCVLWQNQIIFNGLKNNDLIFYEMNGELLTTFMMKDYCPLVFDRFQKAVTSLFL